MTEATWHTLAVIPVENSFQDITHCASSPGRRHDGVGPELRWLHSCGLQHSDAHGSEMDREYSHRNYFQSPGFTDRNVIWFFFLFEMHWYLLLIELINLLWVIFSSTPKNHFFCVILCSFSFFLFFFFLPHPAACRILVPQPRIESVLLEMKAPSPDHRGTP